MRSDTWSRTQQNWLQSGFPLTIALIALKTLSIFLATPNAANSLLVHFYYVAPDNLVRPWTLVTYAGLSHLPFLSFLFEIGLTYWFCSSLERSWGTRTFSAFLLLVTLTSSLALTIGSFLFKQSFVADPMTPIAAAGIAWGILNAEEQMQFFFIPMRGIHVSLLAAGYVMFQYAQSAGWLPVPLAMLSCGVAYFWANNGWQYKVEPILAPSTKKTKRPNLRLVDTKPRPKDDKFTPKDLNPLRWLNKRSERKKFERMMRDD